MKISVIIPAYNEASGISESLKAILAQDYPDFEVMVIDNASTDGTAEVCKAFTIKVLHESRKGTMWACERGRQEASGDIIVRMDADCLPPTDWLARGAKHFEDEKVVIASGPYYYFDGSAVLRAVTLFGQKTIYALAHSILQKLKKGGVTVGGNTFIRASTLKESDGFDTSITFYGDDTALPKQLASYGKCVYDTSLVMPTSARRFKETGSIRLATRYIYHFFKIVFS